MILRRFNILGQERFDAPHLRAIESSVAADFDVMAGQMIAGNRPQILSGFQIIGTVGSPADTLQLSVIGGTLMHPLATESGTIFAVAADRTLETLNVANTRVEGSFTSGQTNFVGIDLRRATDATTSDIVQFLDPDTDQETAKKVPLGILLDYKIIITALDPSALPNFAPIAKIVTDSTNSVVSLVDIRNRLFRLASGGSAGDPFRGYEWPGGRDEQSLSASFTVGDKSTNNLKDDLDAIKTRIWEIGGGKYWYHTGVDKNARLIRTGSTFSNGEYFEVVSSNLHWKNLRFEFDNCANSVRYNLVADQTSSQSGPYGTVATDLVDGDCLYIDIDRTSNTTVNAIKAQTASLGTPNVPGTRFILAWRENGTFFSRDSAFPVGATFTVATNTALGIVELTYPAGTPLTPKVPPQDANGVISNTATTATFPGLSGTGASNGDGVDGAGTGIGAGVNGTGGGTNGTGVVGTGGGVTGVGVSGTGGTGGTGVVGVGNGAGAGGNFTGGATGAAVEINAGFIEGTQMTAPATPAANTGRIYFKSNGISSPNHRTQLIVKWPDGSEDVIAESPES